MYIADTNVLSETNKKRVNAGVQAFFRQVELDGRKVYISVVTVGELRRRVYTLRHKNDDLQAASLEKWVASTLQKYAEDILCGG